jgi:hypothetical protein
MLAVPYFVEWHHRREREERIKELHESEKPGTHAPISEPIIRTSTGAELASRSPRVPVTGIPASVRKVIIESSTEVVLAAGSTRVFVAGIGAVLIVLSFLLLIFFSAACPKVDLESALKNIEKAIEELQKR